MSKLSRRKIAAVWAGELIAGRDITDQIAAYLVEERRVSEAALIVRDTESALAARGVIVADVASAHELSADARAAIEKFLVSARGAKRVELRAELDTDLLGGVRVNTADEQLDTTLRGRLNKLKASKI
ncbi:MAG: F0F1 ATP synthase subunit delta [Candidatus Saccharimonadales bacterium]